MSVLLWIIFGAVAGYLAQRLETRATAGGVLGGIFSGAVGALIGGTFATVLFEGGTSPTFFSFILAILGSVLFLLFFHTAFTMNDEK